MYDSRLIWREPVLTHDIMLSIGVFGNSVNSRIVQGRIVQGANHPWEKRLGERFG